MTSAAERTPLFVAGAIRCFEMSAQDIASLQQFFEANPEYHIAVTGEAPKADEAQEEFESALPAGWPFRKKWLLRFVDDSGALAGMADLIEDLFVEGVWHIGLFVVGTSLHGSGTAPALYESLESWMHRGGARWSRLGVVEGNLRAERFWERRGYLDLRRRCGVEMGKRVNTVRVMVKPLAGGSVSEYLALVARDRPESP